jgi:hypothetical protein
MVAAKAFGANALYQTGVKLKPVSAESLRKTRMRPFSSGSRREKFPSEKTGFSEALKLRDFRSVGPLQGVAGFEADLLAGQRGFELPIESRASNFLAQK